MLELIGTPKTSKYVQFVEGKWKEGMEPGKDAFQKIIDHDSALAT